jgi:hypothetical protein
MIEIENPPTSSITLVGGSEHFSFFHSVGNFIIPTETTNQIIINHYESPLI